MLALCWRTQSIRPFGRCFIAVCDFLKGCQLTSWNFDGQTNCKVNTVTLRTVPKLMFQIPVSCQICCVRSISKRNVRRRRNLSERDTVAQNTWKSQKGCEMVQLHERFPIERVYDLWVANSVSTVESSTDISHLSYMSAYPFREIVCRIRRVMLKHKLHLPHFNRSFSRLSS